MAEKDYSRKRKLSAIMFTDLKDFSKKMQADEAGTLVLLEKYNSIIKTDVKKCEGEIVKTVGDAFLVDFSSAVNAVQCALTIQEDCRFYNKGKPEETNILIRIGIHIGDVVLLENDIMGDAVNIASRIEPFADPGGICISRDVYNQIQGKLQVQTICLGAKELKNIKERVEIYKILVDSLLYISPSFEAKLSQGLSESQKLKRAILVTFVIMGVVGGYVLIKLGKKKEVTVQEPPEITVPAPVPTPSQEPAPLPPQEEPAAPKISKAETKLPATPPAAKPIEFQPAPLEMGTVREQTPKILQAKNPYDRWVNLKELIRKDRSCQVYLTFEEGEGNKTRNLAFSAGSPEISPEKLFAKILGANWVKGGRFPEKPSLSFDGINTMVELEVSDGAHKDFAIEAWIKTSSGKEMGIVDRTTNGQGYFLGISSSGKLLGYIGNAKTGVKKMVFSRKSVNDGRWHHVVFLVFRRSSEGMKLFVDGKDEGSADPTSVVNLVAGSSLTIGSRNRMFEGLIDQVTIYNRALFPKEIILHYLAGSTYPTEKIRKYLIQQKSESRQARTIPGKP